MCFSILNIIVLFTHHSYRNFIVVCDLCILKISQSLSTELYPHMNISIFMLCKYFSHSVGCSFISVIVTFAVYIFSDLMQSHLFIFVFLAYGTESLKPISWSVLYCFFVCLSFILGLSIHLVAYCYAYCWFCTLGSFPDGSGLCSIYQT